MKPGGAGTAEAVRAGGAGATGAGSVGEKGQECGQWSWPRSTSWKSLPEPSGTPAGIVKLDSVCSLYWAKPSVLGNLRFN